MARSRNSRRGSKKARNLGPCFCFLCTGRSQPERQLLRAPRDSVHPYGEVERGEVHDYDACMCDGCWFVSCYCDDDWGDYADSMRDPEPLRVSLLDVVRLR